MRNEMIIYEDFWQLVEEIRNYTKKHPGKIISADFPTKLMFGFEHDDGTCWTIKINKLKESFYNKPSHMRNIEVTRDTFTTHDGKKNFCAMLSNVKIGDV